MRHYATDGIIAKDASGKDVVAYHLCSDITDGDGSVSCCTSIKGKVTCQDCLGLLGGHTDKTLLFSNLK